MDTFTIGDKSYVLQGLNLSIALPYFLFCIVLELVVALLRFRKNPRDKLYRWNDSISSLAAGTVQQISGKLCMRMLQVYSYLLTYHYIGQLFGFRQFWDQHPWLAHVYIFIILDHQYYWAHRFVHECALGWFSHAPHHSSENYNLTTALRQGMWQLPFTFFFYMPIAVTGISPELFALHSQINLLYQFWIHTRAIDRLPFPSITEYILNTPSHHRVHHARQPQYCDKNYGGTLIIFDRLYGTFELEVEAPTYGLVHPIQFFNPVKVQMHVLMELIEASKQYDSFWHKLQIFFRGPGFDPRSQTFYPLPPAPPHEQVALYEGQVKVPRWIRNYSVVHFFVMMAISVIYTGNRMDENPVLSNSVHRQFLASASQFVSIILALTSVVSLLDGGREYLKRYELPRLVISLVFLLISYQRFNNDLLLFVLPLVFWQQNQSVPGSQPLGYGLLDFLVIFMVMSLVYVVAGLLLTSSKIGKDQKKQVKDSLSALGELVKPTDASVLETVEDSSTITSIKKLD